MKIVRLISNTLIGLVLLYAITYTLTLKNAPEATADRLFPYRGVTVITDSMVPTIPVGSLVVYKRLTPNQQLQPGTIISFQANRFGDDITLTHYFMEQTEENGVERFRTQAEGVKDYDAYVTHREDILGTYVFHIPYVGKAAEFMSSVYGLIMFLALLLIWMINRILKLRPAGKPEGQVEVKGVRFHPSIMECSLSGRVENHTKHLLRLITLEISLYNIFNEEIGVYTFDPLGGKPLKPGGKIPWKFHEAGTPNVASYKIISKDMTLEYDDIHIIPQKREKKKKSSHDKKFPSA